MKAFVVFGSESDKPVYDKIASALQDPIVKVCSAHRTPDLLERLLATLEYDAVIAGAGLAAHLPGVVASQTNKPVFGVPVDGNFAGLDSLLAIVQMPPGVPVMATGVGNGVAAATLLSQVENLSRVVLMNNAGEAAEKAIEKCANTLATLGVPHTKGSGPEDGALHIVFVPLDGTAPLFDGPALFVAVQKTQTAQDALMLLSQTSSGVWLGMNRGENAAIAATQLLDRGQYTAALRLQRERGQHKVHSANKNGPATYAAAGVDIDAGNDAVRRLRTHVKQTFTPQVLADVGLFGGLYAFDKDAYDDPVLVASSDGVGTKIDLAARTGSYVSIGQDLVNHCVNDILAQGARPLFFLDYIASAKLDPAIVAQIVEGMSIACKECGCALIGGETAEMPGVYRPGKYDAASCIIGVVERAKIIDGSGITAGDTLIGLPSTGLHTNGYSLVTRVLLEEGGCVLDDDIPGVGRLANALLAVHKNYFPLVTPVLGLVKGIAHITGGGLTENVPRVLPTGLGASIDRTAWEVPALFRFIQETGNITQEEMFRVFNMGIGLVLITSEPEKILAQIEGSCIIGTIRKGEGVHYAT